ncbi:carbohydrate ABC transporter permease [Enterococcus sp.]|uniref:carbohydrate ABC transporter permease n=1 Tax=Enterococcus sp. TaxID=35783 RepID=UPI003C768C90
MKKKNVSLFNVVNVLMMTLFTLIVLVPLWNIVISSLSSSQSLAQGHTFWPTEWSLENYKVVFEDKSIIQSFIISFLRTGIGVITHVFFCAMCAYALSKRELAGRKLYSTMGIITMFFSGGMIPMYLLIRQLGLLNNFLVYILPWLFSYYDVIILMNFFRGVPKSLEESAQIDGANHWRIFLQIYMPVTKPALATIALFNGVAQWNDFMSAKLYITNKALYPLQMKLYEIIVQSQTKDLSNVAGSVALESTTRGVQLATIVITTVPILIIYPMLQKYFMSGMMAGSIKE